MNQKTSDLGFEAVLFKNMSSNTPALYDVKAIMTMLPHRPPFLYVDKILEFDLEKNVIIGLKNVTMNESFFDGHFPGAPIMPGVLIVEALAQVGGILIHQNGYKDKISVIMHLNNTKFRQPVRPGDALYLHVQGVHCSSKGGKVLAKAFVNGKLSVETEIGFALLDKSLI